MPGPVVCTLDDSDRTDRGRAWEKVLGSGGVRRERIPGGIRLTAEPGVAAALMELIELERDCCAWIAYEVSGSVATLTAEGEGEAVLAGMFVTAQ
jgi:hypothetical protein